MRENLMNIKLATYIHISEVMLMVFNTTFNNILARSCMMVSFIGGGNRSNHRKPLTCHKSLSNFIT